MNRQILGRLLSCGLLSAAFFCLISACSDSHLVEAPVPDENSSFAGVAKQHGASGEGPGALTVMTRNVYVGGNVDLIIAAAEEEVPFVVAQIFDQVVSTNFAERAHAFAKEIADTRPHLVGLQEISIIYTQSPGDLVIGGSVPAETIFLDQLGVLMDALGAHGQQYRVVGAVENLDVEVPMFTGVGPLPFDDVRLTDYDVLLARSDVSTSNVSEVNYVAALPVPGLGLLTRGYVAADATVAGRTFRVFTSHLEPVSIPEILPVQLGQIQQLTAAAQGLDTPVVIMGDLNTGPGQPGYDALIENGLVDLWHHNVGPGGGSGYTCCFPDDLRGEGRTPDLRIDLVLYRSPNASHGNDGLGSVFVELVGDEPRDITPSGLWPSDHVGVVASLRAPASAWAQR